MKCDNCPAIVNIGTYEYPEYDCCVMNDTDIMEFKDGSSGCRRKSFAKLERDIEKQRKLEMEYWDEYCENLLVFINREEEMKNAN